MSKYILKYKTACIGIIEVEKKCFLLICVLNSIFIWMNTWKYAKYLKFYRYSGETCTRLLWYKNARNRVAPWNGGAFCVNIQIPKSEEV